MQQKQTFSAQTLALSVAAAELGRAIFGAGQTGSVRAVLLSNVLAAAAFLLLAALVSVNASRLNRPGFAGKCICAVFLFWYLFELVRTAAMLQQACWEQFASMAFIGLLPFFLWAGWSLGCELYDRMASVLGWLVVLGIVFCVLGAGRTAAMAGARDRRDGTFVCASGCLFLPGIFLLSASL